MPPTRRRCGSRHRSLPMPISPTRAQTPSRRGLAVQPRLPTSHLLVPKVLPLDLPTVTRRMPIVRRCRAGGVAGEVITCRCQPPRRRRSPRRSLEAAMTREAATTSGNMTPPEKNLAKLVHCLDVRKPVRRSLVADTEQSSSAQKLMPHPVAMTVRSSRHRMLDHHRTGHRTGKAEQSSGPASHV